MTRRTGHRPPPAPLLLAVLALAAGCGGGAADAEKGGRKGKVGTRVVSVDEIEQMTLVRTGTYRGELRAEKVVEVAPDVQGRIERLHVDMGARVEKGDLLLELDPVEMNQLVREGRARKEMAAAQMEQAEVDLENALSDLERRKPLAAKGIVTESEMEDLENAVKAKRSGLAVAEASYAQASASLTNLVVNRKNLKVRAPFDGLVARRYLNEGAMASPAHPVFQLHAEGKLYVRIAVPEEDVPFVRRGMAGTLRVDALSGRELTATVELVSPVLEQVTRTCTVDLLVETGDELAQVLKPGMTGEVTMVLDELSEALALPRDALVDTGREPVVFVVEDGRAVREPVEVLGEYDDFLHVRGLGDGDRVVVKGQLDLEDGVPVSVATLE